MNNERLEYLKSYFKEEELVKVEVPPQIHETRQGRVISYYNDTRCGYKFVDGIAMVQRKDLYKFREDNNYMIIHDTPKEAKDGDQ